MSAHPNHDYATNEALAGTEARLGATLAESEARLAALIAQSEARMMRWTMAVGIFVVAAITIIKRVL